MRWPGRSDASFQHTGFPLQPAPGRVRFPWMLALSLAASAGLLGAALVYLKGETLRAGERLTQSLAQVIGEQTSRTLQAVDERLQLTASRLRAMKAEGTLNEESARVLLRGQLKGLSFVRAMWVMDRDGRIILDSDVGNIGISLADRAYFQVYKQRPAVEFFVGPVVRSRTTGTWLMSASRPLRDDAGGFDGIIVAAVEPPYFEQVWRGIELGRGGAVSLFSREGRLMMRSPPDDAVMGKDFSQTPLFTQFVSSGPQGVFVGTSPVDARERVTAWRQLPSYPELLVVVGSAYDEMLAPWRRFAALTLAVWLMAALMAAGLSVQVRRQSRRRLREELRFRQLAQAMPQIVFITNSTGQVQFINDRWTEATGHPPERALGRGWAELIHPGDRDESLQTMTEMIRGGRELQREHRLLYRDGVYRWQLLRAVPARDDAGNIVSWHGTSTDIDELKRAQALLKGQADMLGTASRLAKVGAWVVEVAEQRIVWSDEACAILDMPPGSSPTLQEVFDLFSPGSRDKTVEAVERCVKEGIPFDVEVEMTTVTGRPVWVRSIGRAVRDPEGNVVRIEGAQQDITQRVKLMAEVRELNFGLEERIARRTSELRANEAALRLANEQLGSFSYSVSHDLQSPLQRVASFAQLLEEELGPAPPGRAQHYLARIRANTTYMTQLIDGLLALAHVSEITMVRGVVNLSDMATEILERMQAEEPERAVTWRVEPGLAITGDARLIRSVMENLLGNAWKFTSRREHAQISFGGSAERGEYFVADNGAGFDMAYADKLFGTFQRLHREDEFEGTGIGLATVARAIARQGGRTWATAELDKGAVFHFSLPGVPPAQ
ncbi:MAG: multi-sensor signal transduction histidine kinase [Ramlibacter sp.]|nr:multi-sensor signal transduction histidine kinase [Ramlibacter sp.]